MRRPGTARQPLKPSPQGDAIPACTPQTTVFPFKVHWPFPAPPGFQGYFSADPARTAGRVTRPSQAQLPAVHGSWQRMGFCRVCSEMGLGDAGGRALADADVFPQLAPPQPWV